MKYYVNLKINNHCITRGKLYPIYHMSNSEICTITDNHSDLVNVGNWDHSLILDETLTIFHRGQS